MAAMDSAPASSRFATLLAPLSPDAFFASHWEQRYVYVKREDPSYYQGLFSIAKVDAYLALARQNPAATLFVAHVGKPVQRMRVADSEPSLLYQAFHEGSSIVFEGVDQVWPPLFDLARMLGRSLSAAIQINAYLTPPNSQGAHIHPDIHDVIAIHLEGHKQWSLYEERTIEPLESLRHIEFLGLRGTGSAFEREEVDLTLAESVQLGAGDLLYLPRGVVHKAVASDRPSLHLAVVVEPFHWVDLVKAAAEAVSTRHHDLARALPPDFAARDTAALADSLHSNYRKALELLDQPGVLEDALELLQRARMSQMAQVGDDHFEQLSRLDAIHETTWMARRQGLSCLVSTSPAGVAIRFARNQVKGPLRLAQTFTFIRDHERFQVKDLPGPLDDNSKLVLARRLLREGLLRIDEDRDMLPDSASPGSSS